MSLGLRRPPADIPLPLASNQPHGPTNFRFQLIFDATNKPIHCPGFVIAPGLSVTLKGVNGVTANAQNAYANETPEGCATTSAKLILPNADVVAGYPVSNLCEIWVMGTAGDGVLIEVQGGSVG